MYHVWNPVPAVIGTSKDLAWKAFHGRDIPGRYVQDFLHHLHGPLGLGMRIGVMRALRHTDLYSEQLPAQMLEPDRKVDPQYAHLSFAELLERGIEIPMTNFFERGGLEYELFVSELDHWGEMSRSRAGRLSAFCATGLLYQMLEAYRADKAFADRIKPFLQRRPRRLPPHIYLRGC